MPGLHVGLHWEYFQHFATLSMTMLIAASVAYLYRRYVLAAWGFFAVGIGGSAVVWSRWSERAGALNNFRAFADPTGIAFNEVFMLVTHAPFVAVGAFILWRHTLRHR